MRASVGNVDLVATPWMDNGKERFAIAMKNDKTGEKLGLYLNEVEVYQLCTELKAFFYERRTKRFEKEGFEITSE